MNILELFKRSAYDQYVSTSEITIQLVLMTLFITTLIALFIVLIYKVTYKGAIFSSEFATSLVLTCLVTSVVILPMSTNLTLSLGMVGAIRIIRYRTAVKNPRDIAYMFWSISAGLISGAGFFLIAIAGTAFIALVMLILTLISTRALKSEPCIAVFRLSPNGDVDSIKKLIPKMNVKSLVVTDKYIEMTGEIPFIPERKMIKKLQSDGDVKNVSFVKYNGDYAI